MTKLRRHFFDTKHILFVLPYHVKGYPNLVEKNQNGKSSVKVSIGLSMSIRMLWISQ